NWPRGEINALSMRPPVFATDYCSLSSPPSLPSSASLLAQGPLDRHRITQCIPSDLLLFDSPHQMMRLVCGANAASMREKKSDNKIFPSLLFVTSGPTPTFLEDWRACERREITHSWRKVRRLEFGWSVCTPSSSTFPPSVWRVSGVLSACSSAVLIESSSSVPPFITSSLTDGFMKDETRNGEHP
ncbi:hypothetical protein BDV06DRAFT_202505, partial [Aspergillus oleicola]